MLLHNPLIYTLIRLKDSDMRFGGCGHENVDIFVQDIEDFRQRNNITQALVLEDLSNEVLYGRALEWWQENRESIDSWNQALLCLKEKFH